LCGIGAAADAAVPAMIAFLGSEDFHTQYWACRVLGRVGAPAALPAVGDLKRLVRDGVASVRKNAAIALGRIGPAGGPDVVAVLETALQDPAHAVRTESVKALGALGTHAKQAAPALDAMLRDAKSPERAVAAIAFWRITGETERPIDALVHAIEDPESPDLAALQFEELGEHAKPAVPRLVSLLDSEKMDTRTYAAVALMMIGAPAKSAVPDLKRLFDDPHEHVRETAQMAVEKLQQE
jgi:HEAT repeat protein